MTMATAHDRAGSMPERHQTDRAGYLLVAFFTVPFFLFNVLPVLFGVYISFTRWASGHAEMEGLRTHPRLQRPVGGGRLQNVFLRPHHRSCVTIPGPLFALFVNKRHLLSLAARCSLRPRSFGNGHRPRLGVDARYRPAHHHYLSFLGIGDVLC